MMLQEKKIISSLNRDCPINIVDITAKNQYTIKIVAHNTAGVDAQFEINMPNVVQYTTPHINLNAVERTSTGVNITTNGEWVGIDGISESPATLILQYKEDSPGSSWISYNNLSASDLNLNKEAISLSLVFDQAYKFRMVLTDKYGTTYTTSEVSLAAGTPILFIDSIQNGVGINCFPKGDGLYTNKININPGGDGLYTDKININNSGSIEVYNAWGKNTIKGATQGSSATYYNYLPAKGGTFAMTSDIPVLPTIEKGSLDIKKTGTKWKVGDCTIAYVRYGNILSYDISVPLNGETASGENIVEGALSTSTTPSFKLAITTNSVGYVGKRAVVAIWGTDDRITVRNASSTDIDNNTSTVHCRGTVIVTDR